MRFDPSSQRFDVSRIAYFAPQFAPFLNLANLQLSF